jgi:release factor glutamine methyltransferase
LTSPEDLLAMDLALGGDDWVPTPHGQFLAEVLAERNLVLGRRVLEVGAGSANHTILLLRQGATQVVATEISPDLLTTTRRNVEHNCPETKDRVEYRVADWLNTEGTFDVLVSNPPFCKSGQRNRRYFLDSLILDGHKRLEPGGSLVFVQSSMADLGRTLLELDRNGYEAEVLDQREGPWRDYYLEDPTFLEEADRVEGGYRVEGGRRIETLTVLQARLRPWTPPPFAHLPGA